MKTVRLVASILFYMSRIAAIFFLSIAIYAVVIVLLFASTNASWLPIATDGNIFTIFYPFTKTPFLLGDYTASFLVTYLFTITFYGLFLWLLSGVFHAFKQQKIFTKKGVNQLSLFYI